MENLRLDSCAQLGYASIGGIWEYAFMQVFYPILVSLYPSPSRKCFCLSWVTRQESYIASPTAAPFACCLLSSFYASLVGVFFVHDDRH